MSMWQNSGHFAHSVPPASVVLHKPHVRTSQMPVTASSKRRQAVPALRGARLRLVSWGGHSDWTVCG
jgi:hypothetical protein